MKDLTSTWFIYACTQARARTIWIEILQIVLKNKPRKFSQLEHLSPCSHHCFCIEQNRKVQIESTDAN
jgi:hypothetical protein